MSCLACLWYHTDPRAAIACYRILPALQKDRDPGTLTGIAPSPIDPTSPPLTSTASDTVFRRSRAGRSGRPKVPAAVQRQKGRERDRAYRERHKAARVAVHP